MVRERWKQVRKIDVHVHVVLHQREGTDLVLNPTSQMLRVMDENNVEHAVALPINFPAYFPNIPDDPGADWVWENDLHQVAIAEEGRGRLTAFADCGLDDSVCSPSSLVRATRELGLCGLKIHPYNLGAPADDARVRRWLEAANELEVPIVFHSNPSGYSAPFDGSSPARIYQAVLGFDMSYCLAHMGGVSFLETLAGGGYVDISGTLPWLAELYGISFCERLLRRIGIQRLLFATDFPIYAYEDYYAVLDAMAFTDDEITVIARSNAERFLQGLPPDVED